MKIPTGGLSHAEKYPKPAWLDLITGRRSASVGMTTEMFPLHNYHATVIDAIDGDTIEVDVIQRAGDNRGLGCILVRERVRLLGYNAPETRGVPDPQPGYDATQALLQILPIGSTVYLHTYFNRRSFNRVLAWGYAGDEGGALLDIAAAMIAGGHGVEA